MASDPKIWTNESCFLGSPTIHPTDIGDITHMAIDTNFEISTRDGAIIVSTRIGTVNQRAVTLGSKVTERWFHSLLPVEDQRMGKGYMRKREALEAALKVAIDRGNL